MATPKFADVGKLAEDLFTEDFGASTNQLTLKSKALNGTTFKVEGSRSNINGKVNGLLETKFTHKASGLALKEKWTTDNKIAMELVADDKLVKGLSNTLCANFSTNGGGISGLKLKNGFVHGGFNSTLDLTAKDVAASGTFLFNKNWIVGASTVFNLGSNSLQRSEAKVGFVDNDIAITASITDGGNASASVFHKATADVVAGVQLGWSNATGQTLFALAGQYDLDATAFAKVKVDSNLNVGLSYVQALRRGVSLRLSADIAGAALNSDAHKLGLHLTLDNTK